MSLVTCRNPVLLVHKGAHILYLKCWQYERRGEVEGGKGDRRAREWKLGKVCFNGFMVMDGMDAPFVYFS